MAVYDELSELRPLPIHSDYDAAYALFDAELGKGGAWVDVMRRSVDISDDHNRSTRLLTISALGLAIRSPELIDLDEELGDEPDVTVARAFSQGFLQQAKVLQSVYSPRLDYIQANQTLLSQYNAQQFTVFTNPSYRQRINNAYMHALSEYGESRLSSTGRDFVRAWSEDTYPNDGQLANAFRMGHFTMIITGLHYQNAINERLFNQAHENIDLNMEVMKRLFDNSGEEQ